MWPPQPRTRPPRRRPAAPAGPSYDFRLTRASAEADGDTAAQMTLAKAIEETQGALEELRELAHGIYIPQC
jgi:hypothetical protein